MGDFRRFTQRLHTFTCLSRFRSMDPPAKRPALATKRAVIRDSAGSKTLASQGLLIRFFWGGWTVWGDEAYCILSFASYFRVGAPGFWYAHWGLGCWKLHSAVPRCWPKRTRSASLSYDVSCVSPELSLWCPGHPCFGDVCILMLGFGVSFQKPISQHACFYFQT